jgi:hypothetical protein
MSFNNYEDVEAIKVLRSRYFRAMDTGDYDTYRSLLCEDLVTDLRGGTYHFQYNNREDFIEAVASALDSSVAARHMANLPEITITSPTTAEGIWYLHDWCMVVATRQVMEGSILIHDRYRKTNGQWQISHYQYQRVTELSYVMPEGTVLTAHYLGQHGRKPRVA